MKACRTIGVIDMAYTERIVWSNINLNYNDWKPDLQEARNVVFQQMTHALGLDLLTDAQAEQLVQLCTPVKD